MISTHSRRQLSRSASAYLIMLALAVAVAGPASAAHAAPDSRSWSGPFGLIAAPGPGGQPRSYFNLAIRPGASASDSAIVTNEGSRTQRLKLSVSVGVTAANSGSAYETARGRCAGVSCWVTGLPGLVRLAPGARRLVKFTVSVPAGTRRGQYLAGLTATPAATPQPVRIGSRAHASARAIIIDQVTVGVAITVGPVASLRTALRISGVSAGWIGPTPRLSVGVRNTGQTFVRATGHITCRSAGRRHRYPIIMQTVLPGGSAALPVNAKGLASGSLPCRVRLTTDAGPVARWRGVVRLQARTPVRIYHPAKSVYVALPEGTIPPWAVALIVLGALILVTLLAVLGLGRRRRARLPGSARPRHRQVRGRTARIAAIRRRRGGPSAHASG